VIPCDEFGMPCVWSELLVAIPVVPSVVNDEFRA
jgi:hypothetical protein